MDLLAFSGERALHAGERAASGASERMRMHKRYSMQLVEFRSPARRLARRPAILVPRHNFKLLKTSVGTFLSDKREGVVCPQVCVSGMRG
jgi:hypothetical protein